MTAQSAHERGVRVPWRPPLRLLPCEVGAALQLSEGQVAGLLVRGELRDVSPSYRVEFDPAEVVALAQEWGAAGRVSKLCVLAARCICEGRIDIPRPVDQSARPPTPLDLIERAGPMHPSGPIYVHKERA
jgi:hypothetical protein